MEKTFQPGDPRLCHARQVSVSTSGSAAFVVIVLGKDLEGPASALSAMTPAQAREVALWLWEGAETADQTMNAALQQKGGN